MSDEQHAESNSAESSKPAERPATYQRTGAPGPGSPEYEAMDKLAKMFEAGVEDLRGEEAPKQH